MIASVRSMRRIAFVGIVAMLWPGVGFSQEGIIIFDDGSSHVFSDEVEQIIVRNGSAAIIKGDISANHFSGMESAIVVEDSATVFIIGGQLNSTYAGILGSGTTRTEMSDGMLSAGGFDNSVGFGISDDAVLNLVGGIVDLDADVNAVGIRTENRSSVKMTGGLVRGSSDGAAVYGVFARDESTTMLNGGAIELHLTDGGLSTTFINSADNAHVVVTNTRFKRTGGPSSGTGTARIIEATGRAKTEFRGGHVDVQATGNVVDVIGFLASGDSHLVIQSGDINLNANADTTFFENRASVIGIVARDRSRTEIFGGSLTLGGVSDDLVVRHLEAHDEAEVIIHGSDFNYPTFRPIEAMAGTIEGKLSDGTPITYSFERSRSSGILLVPESSLLRWPLILMLILVMKQRRSGCVYA